MDLAVALNGEKRRNLEFYAGDDTTINLTVYQNDGDEDPITVNNLSLIYGTNTGAIGTSSPAHFAQREPYSIVGYVGVARTTLAYGLLIRKGYGCAGPVNDGLYEPLFVRNQVTGGSPGSYFEGPGLDGGSP